MSWASSVFGSDKRIKPVLPGFWGIEGKVIFSKFLKVNTVGQSFNPLHGAQRLGVFTLYRPRKAFVRIEPKLPRSPELDEKMDAAGLDVMDYDARWGRYRINLQTEDVEKHKELLQEITRLAYAAMNGD